MSRTRIVFFGVLATFVALIALGLGANIVNPRTLQQLFIAATVFAGGVVLLDMFGFLGHHADAADDAGTLAGHMGDGGHATGGHYAGDHATSDLPGTSQDLAHDGDSGAHAHDGSGHDGSAEHGQSHADQATHSSNAAAPIISALTYLRLLVYFSLGFGPVGWIAIASGRPPLISLALGTVVGIGALFVAQWFFRLQRKDTDSQVLPEELLASDATVIVPLDGSNMGKVRVRVGVNVEDLYALPADPNRAYDKGATVRIARVTDECVYVR